EEQRLTEARQRQEEIAKTQRKPILFAHQCCNPTAIINVTNTQDGTYIKLPITADDKQGFTEGMNVGFVAKFKNIGLGPALNVKALWHPVKVIDAKGEHDVSKEVEPIIWHPFAIPYVLQPGEEAEIHTLPACILKDDTKGVVKV